jgi:two-component system response regulator FixJ
LFDTQHDYRCHTSRHRAAQSTPGQEWWSSKLREIDRHVSGRRRQIERVSNPQRDDGGRSKTILQCGNLVDGAARRQHCHIGRGGKRDLHTLVFAADITYSRARIYVSDRMRIVYIVDDDDIIRKYLSAVLSAAQLTCRMVESAEAFLTDYDPQQPGCLLLDVQMPGMTGLELQRQLNRRGATIPVIFITGHGEIPMVVEALSDGAFGFLQKPVATATLLEQVHKALDRDESNRAELLEREQILQRFELLTPRERDVLGLMMAGRSNKAMAGELLLSQRTVELYRARVMEKTGSRSLAQLVQMAMELNTLQPARPRPPTH